MQEEQSSPKFIPFECPQCKHINNLMTDSRCDGCGLLFRRSKVEPPKRVKPVEETITIVHSPRANATSKMAIIAAVVAIIAVSGFVVMQRRSPSKRPPLIGAPVLPANGWYQPRLTNFYREWPTRDEVYAKSVDAMKISDVTALTMSGNFAVIDDVPRNVDQKMVEDLKASKSAPATNRPTVNSVGRVEITSSGDKVRKRLSMSDSTSRMSTDLTEIFDGAKALRTRAVNGGPAEPMPVEGADLDNLRRLAMFTDRGASASDYSFQQIVGAGEKVVFGLRDERPDRGLTYFYDAENGLALYVEGQNLSCFMIQYATISGVNLPSEMRCRFQTSRNHIDWYYFTELSWKVNPTVDAAAFQIR